MSDDVANDAAFLIVYVTVLCLVFTYDAWPAKLKRPIIWCWERVRAGISKLLRIKP